MSECPYLIYKTSKSCASCTGYRCTSAGREKKVDELQLEVCRDINEYVNCTRYIETLPVSPLETLELEPLEEPSLEYEAETVELPPSEEVTTFTGVGVETIKVTFEDDGEEEEPAPPLAPVKRPCGCGSAHPNVRHSDCPYQGPAPEGMQSCLGIWCYADNKNIRVDKVCVNWKICTVYLMSKYKGVPYYANQ